MTDALSPIFAALADPTRRAILAMLLEDDMAVTDVAEPFQMSLAANRVGRSDNRIQHGATSGAGFSSRSVAPHWIAGTG